MTHFYRLRRKVKGYHQVDGLPLDHLVSSVLANSGDKLQAKQLDESETEISVTNGRTMWRNLYLSRSPGTKIRRVVSHSQNKSGDICGLVSEIVADYYAHRVLGFKVKPMVKEIVEDVCSRENLY